MRRKIRLIGGGIVVAALVIVGVGARLVVDAVAERDRMEETTARIEQLNLETHRDREGHTSQLYRPTLSFSDTAGRPHTVLSRTAVYPAPGRVGETIPIEYDPADATTARPRGAGVGYTLAIIWIVAGVIFGLVGVTVYRAGRG